MQTHTLYFREGTADKQFALTLDGGTVTFAWGRRGSTQRVDTQTLDPIAAEKRFNAKLREKLNEGYLPGDDAAPLADMGKTVARIESDYRPMLLNPITEAEAMVLIRDDDWFMQEKADGVRGVIEINPEIGDVQALSRTSKPVAITREIKASLLAAFKVWSVIDAEVIGESLVIFDILCNGVGDIRDRPCEWRIDHLEAVARNCAGLPGLSFIQTARTESQKRAALAALRSGGAEGIVLKHRRAPYTPDRPNSYGNSLKWKFCASATVMVVGHHKDGKRSVEIAVLDAQGQLVKVGHCTIAAKHGALPRPGTICECGYLYAYRGGSLVQAVFKGIRTDKTVPDSVESLQFKAESRV